MQLSMTGATEGRSGMAERGSVLVTGAGGVIGAHGAAEYAASDGWRFFELSDQPAARKVIPPLG